MNNDNRLPDTELEHLLDGRLPAAEAGRTRRRLARTSRLLQRELRSYLQQRGMTIPRPISAPASLRARIRTIPGRSTNRFNTALRWGLAATVAGSLLMIPVIYHYTRPADVPSQAEIIQARAELTIALGYLQQVTDLSDYYMKREISHTMQDALLDGIFLGVTQKSKKG